MVKFRITLKLHYVRTTKKITQIKLSRLTGISQSHISEIELGKQSPTLKTLEKIANALKVNPLELIEIINKQ